MNIPEQPVNWRDVVAHLDLDALFTNPLAELERVHVPVNDSLKDQVERLKQTPEERRQVQQLRDDLRTLQTLDSPGTTSADRRQAFARLAERYRQFLGWEGIGQEEPGW